VINVIAAALVPAPCAGYSVLIAYSKSSGATIIQCSDPLNAQENKAFIYDRFDHSVGPLEYEGGRFIRPDSFGEIEKQGVPDKFGRIPLCGAKDREAPAAGQLVIVRKQPNASDDAPYCYRVNYVVAGKNSLAIRSDDGHQTPALSKKSALRWAKAQEELSRYIDVGSATGSTKPARTASVIAEKAQLFFSPDSGEASKMYLVRGDKVEVIDDRKLRDGWCRVRYVTKTGRGIERWAQTRDLDVTLQHD